MANLLEQMLPGVMSDGIQTNKTIVVGGAAGFDMSGSTGTFKTPTGTFTVTNGFTVPTGKVLTITDTVGATLGGVLIPLYETIQDIQNQQAASAYAVSHTIFIADNVSGTYKVAAVTASFGTASSSATLQVEVATGTQAIASGTNQLTGTISLAGTANTAVNGTIIASPTTVAAGNRVNLIFAGTVTSLANAIVSVALQRLS